MWRIDSTTSSSLSHSFRTQPGLREALDNPVISMKDKLVLVCTAADGDGKSSRDLSVSLRWFCETGAKAIYSLSA